MHGDSLTTNEFWYHERASHLEVADLVLWEAISWELVHAELLGKKAREHAEWFSNTWNGTPASDALIHAMMTGIMGINTDDYHEGLSWKQNVD